MKNLLSSFLAFICLGVFLVSCEKENISSSNVIINASVLTEETSESLAKKYDESAFNFPEIHTYLTELQTAQDNDGVLTLSEVNAVGSISNLDFLFAFVNYFAFSKEEIQLFIEEYELEYSASESRRKTEYRWTGGAKKQFGWWRWKYYKYPCKSLIGGFGDNKCRTDPFAPFSYRKCHQISCNKPSKC